MADQSDAAQQLLELNRASAPKKTSANPRSSAAATLSSIPDRINAAIYPASLGAIRDVANRAAINVMGAPVDAAAVLTNSAIAAGGLAGHKLGLISAPPDLIQSPVGGSEWLGKQFEDARIVSPLRRPAAEYLATLAAPAVGTLGARAIGAVSDLSPATAPSRGSTRASAAQQLGAISPEGKARLLADLQAGKGSGTYRLGDVTQGQARALENLGTPPTMNRDVMMTDRAFSHLYDGRVLKDNFSPADVTRFTEQAMSKSSQAEFNQAKVNQNPALVNRKLLDAETGKRYDAQIPFRVEDGNLIPATVFPRGLPARNKKPPTD